MLAAETDCEMLRCRRQAVQPSHPPQHLSNHINHCHGHAVTALNVPETAASVLVWHFRDWYWGCLLWQCHAVVCTCSRIWNLAASIGILHKDQTMTNLDRNVRRLAARGKVLVFKDENVWGGHVGRDSSSCPNWFFFCYVFHMAFSWLFKSSGLGFVFLQGIQINPATSFGHSI